MPVLHFASPTLTSGARQAVATILTGTAIRLSDAAAEKVQIFFQHAADATNLDVHAIGADPESWEGAFHSSLDPIVDQLGLPAASVIVYPYDHDHTAKAGVLRTPPVS